MSYPVGIVAISKISDNDPVWVKTASGWSYVMALESTMVLMPMIADEDFETDGSEQWLMIEPLGLIHG